MNLCCISIMCSCFILRQVYSVDVDMNLDITSYSGSELMQLPLERTSRADSEMVKQFNKTIVTIVVYDKIRGYLNWMQDWFILAAKEKCSTTCVLTEERRYIAKADMIIFHAPTHSSQFPANKGKNVIYTLLSMEQPKYATLLSNPGNILEQHFDLLSTYSLESYHPGTKIPNLPITYYPLHLLSPNSVLQPSKPFHLKNGYNTDVSVAMFTSNCHNAGATGRFKYIQELMKYIKVHSYGKCLHNREEPLLPDDPLWPPIAQR
mmetsp:Transcript_15079/g.14467  ORF Transcript_15079/g.14467 Transcript_15079/m.14467 type:complete len:263 (-) Transcript_15079:73-861(-)